MMLELKTYTKAEMVEMFQSNNNEAIKRKLKRYGVEFIVSGRGQKAEFTITQISDPFKVFCIIELGIQANTDFEKLCPYFYYLLNEDDFTWLPDEAAEDVMRQNKHSVSRQTIRRYKEILQNKNWIASSGAEYIYYFAYQSRRFLTDKETYSEAWQVYWDGIRGGLGAGEAMGNVIYQYGGCPRKQPKVIFNGIYDDKINQFSELVWTAFEAKLSKNE